MSSSSSSIISKQTISRLVQDVKHILKDPTSLNSNGIYYIHDQEDMLKGYALIVGPENTPYFGGFYFFEFYFPTDYPYSPPKLIFKTNAEKIRFNPNLYTNGKVCVSILNTWNGPGWSSCQTITTVLLSLCTLFCSDPLLNEPGVDKKNRDFNNYTTIIEYKNVDIAILKIVNQQLLKDNDCKFKDFYPIVMQHFIKNSPLILAELEKKKNDVSGSSSYKIVTQLYSMSVPIDYTQLHLYYESIFTEKKTNGNSIK